jgi:hypothetical protein
VGQMVADCRNTFARARALSRPSAVAFAAVGRDVVRWHFASMLEVRK